MPAGSSRISSAERTASVRRSAVARGLPYLTNRGWRPPLWLLPHVAQVKRLLEACNRISRRDEFLPDKALVAGSGDGTHDGRIVELLFGADFMPSMIAAGVIVCNHLGVSLDGADNIAFHYLHVVDIVEQLDPR